MCKFGFSCIYIHCLYLNFEEKHYNEENFLIFHRLFFICSSQFVAQPNCQQLLASRWYDELPGWRRRHWAVKFITCIFIGLLFPLLSIFYLISPKSRYGLFIRKPFIKFICHTASYLTFLFLLFLASQHINTQNPGYLAANCQGPAPTVVEWIILPWVIGNNELIVCIHCGVYCMYNCHTFKIVDI